ncbi:MAG: hypothetical protein OIF34_07695, partial [Porticoccaceae bacterium]|nr:hypothetical protein [Porticoccaceae bacterium]
PVPVFEGAGEVNFAARNSIGVRCCFKTRSKHVPVCSSTASMLSAVLKQHLTPIFVRRCAYKSEVGKGFQTVCGMDAAEEPTWMYLRRVWNPLPTSLVPEPKLCP